MLWYVCACCLLWRAYEVMDDFSSPFDHHLFNILAIGAVQFFSKRLFVAGAQEGIVFKVDLVTCHYNNKLVAYLNVKLACYWTSNCNVQADGCQEDSCQWLPPALEEVHSE